MVGFISEKSLPFTLKWNSLLKSRNYSTDSCSSGGSPWLKWNFCVGSRTMKERIFDYPKCRAHLSQ